MNNTKYLDRQPAAAGKYYPAEPDLLKNEISGLFTTAMNKQCHRIRAIIAPHAGYFFSGGIAASAFNQLNSKTTYNTVFILASSHSFNFAKASVYCEGDFIMPYGKENVDIEQGRKLIEEYPDLFSDDATPHICEHSIEVQLPFLHHKLKPGYSIVPILIGTSDADICKKIAMALKPHMKSHNLFVISSDFSHFPAYLEARRVDEITKRAILTNNPETLLKTLSENAAKKVPQLSTSLCGWTSVLTLMYMTSDDNSLKYHAIEYSNSGNTEKLGQKDSVVGYWGITLCAAIDRKLEFLLTDKDRSILLEIARKTLQGYCKHERSFGMDTGSFSDELKTECGAFVTLSKNGKLRGCIGRLTSNIPLYKLVHEMTLSASMHDPRFLPVDSEELSAINIEVSVLSPLKKINEIDEITIGIHGIYIKNGFHNGVFLPQVAQELGWNKEQFLGHCAHDKAGLPWDGWKSSDIYTFTTTVFKE